MKRLEAWLKEEPTGDNIFKLVFIFVMIKLFYSLGAAYILVNYLDVSLNDKKIGIEILTLSFPFILLWLAFIEEVFFRAPLLLFVEHRLSVGWILFVAIIMSAIFGFLHGGIVYIFIQGVGGFLLCILFLKTGGIHGKMFKPLMVCTLSHFIYNAIVLYVAAFNGVTHI